MEKKKYRVPVEWAVSDFVEVEADSFAEAVKYVFENKEEIPLGKTPEYLEETYKISSEDEISLCKQDPRFAEELARYIYDNFGYGDSI